MKTLFKPKKKTQDRKGWERVPFDRAFRTKAADCFVGPPPPWISAPTQKATGPRKDSLLPRRRLKKHGRVPSGRIWWTRPVCWWTGHARTRRRTWRPDGTARVGLPGRCCRRCWTSVRRWSRRTGSGAPRTARGRSAPNCRNTGPRPGSSARLWTTRVKSVGTGREKSGKGARRERGRGKKRAETGREESGDGSRRERRRGEKKATDVSANAFTVGIESIRQRVDHL